MRVCRFLLGLPPLEKLEYCMGRRGGCNIRAMQGYVGGSYTPSTLNPKKCIETMSAAHCQCINLDGYIVLKPSDLGPPKYTYRYIYIYISLSLSLSLPLCVCLSLSLCLYYTHTHTFLGCGRVKPPLTHDVTLRLRN